MKQPTSIIRVALAVMVLATGCAGQGAEIGSALTHPGSSASANGADLKGTWQGSFGQAGAGDGGHIHGDIVCQINGDGTYNTTWITRLVAGSARGGRVAMSGTVVANGSRVIFNDSSSGSRMTLKRAGDTLYGITIDPATKRVTVAVKLQKVQPVHEAP